MSIIGLQTLEEIRQRLSYAIIIIITIITIIIKRETRKEVGKGNAKSGEAVAPAEAVNRQIWCTATDNQNWCNIIKLI